LLKVFRSLARSYFLGAPAFRRRGRGRVGPQWSARGPPPGAVPGEATGMCTQRVGFWRSGGRRGS